MVDETLPQWVNDKDEGVAFHGVEISESEREASETHDDREKYVTLENIAELGWETHRAWERIIGEPPRLPWDQLSPEQQDEIKRGAMFILDNPQAPVRAQHDFWRASQASKPTLNAVGKNMVEFDQLPYSQQMKARLWRHIVHAVVG